MSRLDAVLARLDAREAEDRARYLDWLRIPSVSAQPAHAGDCRRAAEWLRGELAALGFEAAVRETAGHPAVLAHHPGPGPRDGEEAPHLLYYGHYDVQPAEPFELWEGPPFEPRLVEGPRGPQVVARGAVDDKGQVTTWLNAFRAWHAEGGLPARVTVLVEGEEEVGSPSLEAFLRENAAAFAGARAVVISDTGMWDPETPALTTRLRGMAFCEATLRAASRDLHSGQYGGSALNPLHALSRLVASLHDGEGRVAVGGFYEGVEELDAATRAAWAALDFDEAAFLGEVGLSAPAGERGRGAAERVWARPTLDLNGLWGGYTGAGSKTVIAAEAHAKISCRLVGRQEPARVLDAIEAHLRARLPPDATLTVRRGGGAPPVSVAEDTPEIAAARRALEAEFGRPPVMIGAGGSIPVVETFRRVLGLDSVLMGFGLDDDRVHSPNEKFDLACLRAGARSHARLLAEVAGA